MINQKKSVAFLIDPIEGLDFESDSTLLLANEFQARGYELFYLLPQSLIFEARPWSSDAFLATNGSIKGAAHTALFFHIYPCFGA